MPEAQILQMVYGGAESEECAEGTIDACSASTGEATVGLATKSGPGGEVS
ncbi:hypothetical protein M9H77_06924 [Catharanthus roseus]|uniref:Uncharacterized protein n=1 Tax=Catharanthus roseus TaxID=4058 RepID=A0ACC0BTQ4_CATRO|nr:hypothetical protein M9H77_06924 [Catharanthus roseus]